MKLIVLACFIVFILFLPIITSAQRTISPITAQNTTTITRSTSPTTTANVTSSPLINRTVSTLNTTRLTSSIPITTRNVTRPPIIEPVLGENRTTSIRETIPKPVVQRNVTPQTYPKHGERESVKRGEIKRAEISKEKIVINDVKTDQKTTKLRIRGKYVEIDISDKEVKIIDNNIEARGDVEIRYENNKLVAGRSKKQINVMPSTIKEKIAGTQEIIIVDEGVPKYIAKGRAKGKLLWFIDVEIERDVHINAETGKVITEDRPWWDFLVATEPAPQEITSIQSFTCNTLLSQIELPQNIQTATGFKAKEEALQLLSAQGITTAGDLLNRLNNTGTFAQLAVLTGIMPEDLMRIALRAEMRCVYNTEKMSSAELDLLDSAGFRSVYQLSQINSNSLQPQAMSYYLKKIAMAKGYPFYDKIRQEINVAVPHEKIIEWVNTAKSVTAAFTTNGVKDEVIFSDGSEFTWPEPSPELELLGADCKTMKFREWQHEGLRFDPPTSGLVRLDVTMPYHIEGSTIKLVDEENPQFFAERNVIGTATRTFFVRLPYQVSSYKIKLPNAASISQDTISEATICTKFINKEIPPPNATLVLKENEVKYYYITTASNEDVNLTLSWLLGNVKYRVGPPGISLYTGNIDADNQTASWRSPPDLTQPTKPKDWSIILGHFSTQCVLSPPCHNSTLLSFLGTDEQSFIQLEWKRTNIPQRTYYLGYFSKAVFSNDAETAAWEGEMNSFGDAELVDAPQNKRHFQFEYPNYVYKEVEDYDDSDNLPVFYPDVPLLGMQTVQLNNYEVYYPSFTAYEDDSALLHYLNPVTWYVAASDLISAISNGVACVASLGAAVNACANAVCSTISAVGSVSEAVTESEDEAMGTGIGHITKDSRFGLNENQKNNSFMLEGSSTPDGSDWYDDVQKMGDYCSAFAAGDPVKATKLAYSELTDDGEESRWVKARYSIKTYETFPVISQIKVNLTKIHIYTDRDGTFKGAGDMYTYTTVGVIGDKGVLPAPDSWPANPVSEIELTNSNSPFSDVDLMRYPKSGTDDTGDGGDMNPKRIIFYRLYPDGKHIAGLYVEVVTFDSDNFEDDEIGVHSRFYDFHEIWAAITNCQVGFENYQKITLSDGDWCKVIVKTDELSKTFLKGGLEGELWGNKFSRTEYELWLKPTVWP